MPTGSDAVDFDETISGGRGDDRVAGAGGRGGRALALVIRGAGGSGRRPRH